MPDHSSEAIARRRAKTAEYQRIQASLDEAAKLAETDEQREAREQEQAEPRAAWSAKVAERKDKNGRYRAGKEIPEVLVVDTATALSFGDQLARLREKRTADRLARRMRCKRPRPQVRARRNRPRRGRLRRGSHRASSIRGPPADDDGGEGVPPHVARFAEEASLGFEQITWCLGCGVVAFAIDR